MKKARKSRSAGPKKKSPRPKKKTSRRKPIMRHSKEG
jgi:hypothetical protein